ncbi:ABC transporter substrate-binding protein [Vibrio salinus]|uniref:ABC transporter substrate-binding protein n=1 Tax=Vibrio salinus TaxID=2899784 RepID=UPI001E43C901|nr:ABC transporter substrate-binding protein [Vibrio salinus]MCE0495879.1 ABC transporter substrate-binding protein [Vibrio salinus]
MDYNLKKSFLIKKIAIPAILALGIVSLYIYEFSPKQITNNIALSNIRIAASHSPLSAPLIVANHLNLFKKNGLNVILAPCFGGIDCSDRLFNAEADFSTASESVVMFNSFKRDDFSILATFVDSDNDLKLLTTSKRGIKKVADLIGKKVGVVKASASEFYLYSILLINGVSPGKVEQVYLEPENLPEKLYTGEVDAISVWEPYGYLMSLQPDSKIVNLGSQGVYHLTFNLLSMKSYLHSNQQNIQHILMSLDEAIEWINHNPRKAMTIIARALDINYGQLNWTWNDYRFRLSINNSLLSNLQLQARWAKNSDLVKGAVPDYRSFMATAIVERYFRER